MQTQKQGVAFGNQIWESVNSFPTDEHGRRFPELGELGIPGTWHLVSQGSVYNIGQVLDDVQALLCQQLCSGPPEEGLGFVTKDKNSSILMSKAL